MSEEDAQTPAGDEPAEEAQPSSEEETPASDAAPEPAPEATPEAASEAVAEQPEAAAEAATEETPEAEAPAPESEEPVAEMTEAEAVAQAALKAAQDAVSQINAGDLDIAPATPAAGADATPADLPDFSGAAQANGAAQGIDLLSDVNLDVKIELGRTRMLVEDVLRLGEGAVIELDKLAGDPVDIYVNERHVARGEVLILNENFCVRINDVLTAAED